jgi:ABC-type proline/glycine betaine transport system permease subunit
LSWLWPDYADPEPNFGQRLGRLVHWTFVALGALIGAGGVAVALTDGTELEATLLLLAMGFSIALAGRGLRYLFGGE